jgi:PIN domain nuclease of toxin-antitoxin system
MESSALILMDTHVLVWAVTKPDRLSRVANAAILRARAGGGLGISAITLWELAALYSRGYMRAAGTLEDTVQMMIDSAGVTVHPLTPKVAALAAQFPENYPHDPADRLIGATARAEGIPLITRDERIRQSNLLKTIW